MKTIKFLRTAPGIALATAVIATGSVGAYALSNWFGGDVTVKQHSATMSVDLSSCKGNLPVGFNLDDDRHNLQFKIMGNPHISAADLQSALLGECEYNAVTDFYGQKFPDAGISSTGHPAGVADRAQYLLLSGRITAIDDTTVTIASTGAKSASFPTSAFSLAPNLSVYNEGQQSSLSNLQEGDNVMFVVYSASASTSTPMTEGITILDNSDIQILSLFKTRYDTGITSSFDYGANNVMPVDVK